jgi:hypothetical protein
MTPRFGDFRNWLRVPESGEAPRPEDASSRETQETAQQPLKIAEGSDVQEGAIRVSQPKAVVKPLESYTPGGTYIPLSGGMRGWYENGAVPNAETENRYRFSEAVEAEAFKRTILERIESFNRRAAERYKVDLWALHSDPGKPGAENPAERAYCTDLSVRGACLRVRRRFEIGLPLKLSLFRTKAEVERGAALATMQAIVRNTRPAGGSSASPRFYAGLEFHDISIAAKEAIANLIAGATALVPRK